MEKPRVIVLCGPTAVGKTTVAIRLAGEIHAQILNADSMQVYRYMDIGTAKATPEEQREIRHHLIDVVDPDQPFDAATYARLAGVVIDDLHRQHVASLIVGGTGLYIKALVHGLFQAPPSNMDLRFRLKQEFTELGPAHMHERLASIDPQTAARLHPHDAPRILRALEIYEATGKPISGHQGAHGFSDQPYRVMKIGLLMDRDLLYRRIEARVDQMIEAGLSDEVQRLLSMGYGPDLKPMQSIGYRHMVDFLEGRMTFSEAVRTLKRDTRRYAKRQMTWFNKDTGIQWIDQGNDRAMVQAVRLFLHSGG
jgi:tRNA dimethylallyltransferase